MGGRRSKKLKLKKGLYIIGEGITEQFYFSHLKTLNNYKCIIKPRFFGKTDILRITKQVEKLLLGDITVICVFDADVSLRNKVENNKLQQFKNKYKRNKNVIICDSLPSIEFWFLLHFIQTTKPFINSKSVEKELRKHMIGYSKNKTFLEDAKWVEALSNKLKEAMQNSQSNETANGHSYSNIYKAIVELEART